MYKKLIIALILALATFSLSSAATDGGKKVPRTEIKSIVKDFKRYDDFESVTIGKFMMKLIKSVETMDIDDMDDDESKEFENVMKLMKSLDGMIAADYEDCSEAVKAKFNSRMTKALDGVELLMESKDDEDHVYIYGYVTKDGEEIKDLVIFSPEEGNFMCLLGTLKMEYLGELAKSANK